MIFIFLFSPWPHPNAVDVSVPFCFLLALTLTKIVVSYKKMYRSKVSISNRRPCCMFCLCYYLIKSSCIPFVHYNNCRCLCMKRSLVPFVYFYVGHFSVDYSSSSLIWEAWCNCYCRPKSDVRSAWLHTHLIHEVCIINRISLTSMKGVFIS